MKMIRPNNEIALLQNRNVIIEGIDYYSLEVFVDVIYNDVIVSRYAISNYGRLYDRYERKFMIGYTDKDGYLVVSLNIDRGVNKKARIHRITLMSFCPIYNSEKYVANHINGVKNCNYIFNLEWTSVLQNTRHGWEIGTNNNRGDGNKHSVITEAQAHIICQGLEQHKTARQICDDLGLTAVYNSDKLAKGRLDAAISSIKCGRTFKHISCQYNIDGLYTEKINYDYYLPYLVCPLLQEGTYTLEQIMTLTRIPIEQKKYFKIYISDLIKGRTGKEITQYFPGMKYPIDNRSKK